jgi:riboflavin synthase
MFTGLIRSFGTLESRTPRPGGMRLRIAAPAELLERAPSGASICVNGACLTAVTRNTKTFDSELSEETLRRTTFGHLAIGALLHLEPSLRVGEPLDGHLLAGHVDGVGRLVERPEGEGLWRFGMPAELAPMVAPKGSIALDGISLTVVDCGRDWFTVALIPETIRRTRLAGTRPGEAFNLEVDPIGRYVARALAMRAGDAELQRFAQAGWPGG